VRKVKRSRISAPDIADRQFDAAILPTVNVKVTADCWSVPIKSRVSGLNDDLRIKCTAPSGGSHRNRVSSQHALEHDEISRRTALGRMNMFVVGASSEPDRISSTQAGPDYATGVATIPGIVPV